MSRLRERLQQIDSRRIDLTIAIGLSVLVTPTVIFSAELEGPLLVNLALALVATGTLLLRREHPLPTAAITFGACLVLTLFFTPSFLFAPATFSMMVASYSCGAFADGRPSWAGLVLAGGGIGLIAALETPDDIVFPLFIFGITPWVVGRTLRTQTRLSRELAEKEARVRHMHDQEAASAVAVERSRVARELHDVLAHNLSVMVIQASGARRLLGSNPEAAIAAAALIERTGREAMVELRHVLGPVRHGDGEALEGTPGLARLGALVERANHAGLPTELRLEGDAVELSPGADMAAYRLIQEALTNTYKHAGAAPTEIEVRYRPDGVVIEVVDDGPASPTPEPAFDSGGNGLIGMRERVELYGGEVEAGPVESGGFRVRARLPLQRERVTA